MRKVLIGLAGAVVLLVAAALIVPGMIDWNGYKSQIAAQVKAATGRDLAIGGNLDLAVLPSPHLSAADVRFASIPGATEPAMVRLRTLDVQVRFLPLLGGRIEVASVTLVEPIIVLERLADGRENWILGPPAAAPGAPTTSTLTRVTPLPVIPIASAAARERSMILPSTKGPRSLTRTTTSRPLSRLRTRTRVPNASVLCAAVISRVSKISPLAVLRPWNFPAYQEARPSSARRLRAQSIIATASSRFTPKTIGVARKPLEPTAPRRPRERRLLDETPQQLVAMAPVRADLDLEIELDRVGEDVGEVALRL